MSTTYCDSWVWGREQILWGYSLDHRYTLKVLEPFPGRQGCLSLQYHNEKSESWVVLHGVAWALLITDDTVATRILKPGDVQHLPAGTVHRITAIDKGTQILEASTPDRHAADKHIPKDVVRLHCFHGRPVTAPRTPRERALVEESLVITEEALGKMAQRCTPTEVHPHVAVRLGPARILENEQL